MTHAPAPTTLLVVDDDHLVLETLAYGLTEAGYRVLQAASGDEAILLAREHRPDLALLDIRLQGMSGFDVAACLRQSGGVPFLFLSGFCDAHNVAQAEALGAIACLAKPIDAAQILPEVERALA
ncbi:MAG TPA: response regulator, partial [Burkholderiaceae bacterium]